MRAPPTKIRFALQFVERGSEIGNVFNGAWMEDARMLEVNCEIWKVYNSGGMITENGAGRFRSYMEFGRCVFGPRSWRSAV